VLVVTNEKAAAEKKVMKTEGELKEHTESLIRIENRFHIRGALEFVREQNPYNLVCVCVHNDKFSVNDIQNI
jgi:hypothetical protein